MMISIPEINERLFSTIGKIKAVFYDMKKILTNNKMPLKVRKRVLHCQTEPILVYGCETWTVKKQDNKILEPAETWFWRKMQQVPGQTEK